MRPTHTSRPRLAPQHDVTQNRRGANEETDRNVVYGELKGEQSDEKSKQQQADREGKCVDCFAQSTLPGRSRTALQVGNVYPGHREVQVASRFIVVRPHGDQPGEQVNSSLPVIDLQ